MYFHVSDSLLKEQPEYREVILILDRYLGQLSEDASKQINPETISALTQVPFQAMMKVLTLFEEQGIVIAKRMVSCPITGDIIDVVDTSSSFTEI